MKFLLADGIFITAVMREENAKEIIRAWKDGTLTELIPNGVLGDIHPPPGEHCWAVKVADIRAIHSFPADEASLAREITRRQMKAQLAQLAGTPAQVGSPWGKSGGYG